MPDEQERQQKQQRRRPARKFAHESVQQREERNGGEGVEKEKQRYRSRSSLTAVRISTARRSLGRPAARFMRMRSSSEVTSTRRSSARSSSVAFFSRSAYPAVPDGVPRQST